MKFRCYSIFVNLVTPGPLTTRNSFFWVLGFPLFTHKKPWKFVVGTLGHEPSAFYILLGFYDENFTWLKFFITRSLVTWSIVIAGAIIWSR